MVLGMGKKLDAILGRTFKAYKLKPVVNIAISRIAIFKNQRQVRCNQARSDVVQLLEQGHHDRALLRVENVIKDQNMLDVYVMMEGYCNLLVERLHLIEQERECPDELREAISGLLYASTRCGDFPELQEMRTTFASRFGKEFVASAIELRNNCRVNIKMMQKLSTRQTELESRMKVLREIASENGIVLPLEDSPSPSATTEKKLNVNKKQNQAQIGTSTSSGSTKLVDNLKILREETERDELSVSTPDRKKYRDVAHAAQAAFESAAYAAEAARAAVELSRSGPHDPDNENSSNRGRKAFPEDEPMKHEPQFKNQEIQHENEAAKVKGKGVAEMKRSVSASSSETEDSLEERAVYSDAEDPIKQLEKDIVFDESDSESQDLHFDSKLKGKSNKRIPSIIQSGLNVDSRHGYSTPHATEGSRIQSAPRLNIEKGPISVRTRRLRGF